MSFLSASRSLPPPDPLTLATVRDQIGQDTTLAPRRQQELASALNTIARALGRPPGDIPAYPDYLRKRLAGVTPASAGVSPGRWNNVRSLLTAALEHTGLSNMPGRHTEPLAPAWEALFGLLPNAQDRFGLSRLCRYCSSRGIAPNDVDDTILDAFLGDLEGSLVDQPRKVHRVACRSWNEAAQTIADWPKRQVQVPDYTHTYALSWDQLPASLKEDCDAYLARLAGTDPLEELDFRPLRPSSIATRRRQLIEIISAMVHQGVDPQLLRSLADVVRLDHAKSALRFILNRRDQTTGSARPSAKSVQAYQLAQLLAAVARHWVHVTDKHLADLQAFCRQINPGPAGLSATNRARLRQFDDPDAVARFVTMPQRILAKIGRPKHPSRRHALQIQLAVAVELLLVLPMRLQNLAALRIGTHLIRSPRGGWHLTIPGDEVKNRTDIEAIIPPHAGQILDFYLDRFRPLLTTTPSDALFPGRYGGTKSKDGLREQIMDGVAEWAGLTVNPHLFRHILAKLYLEAHPGGYGVVKLLLGHKSIDTTITNYCGTETAKAFEHVDAHMQSFQAAAPVTSRGRRS